MTIVTLTAINLADLKAAATSNLNVVFDGSLWVWTPGDFTGQANDRKIVQANTVALSTGAWVRQADYGVTLAAIPTNYLDGPVVDSSVAFQAALTTVRDSFQYGNNTIGGSYWINQQEGLLLPPSRYRAGDIQLDANEFQSNLCIRAIIPGSVTISVPDGKYFLTVAGKVANIFVDGINFTGGGSGSAGPKGFFKFTNTQTNVAGMMRFTNCIFDGYTECAIGNMSNDAPYLRVRDCTFLCRSGAASAIGIAWGGYIDLLEIESNAFIGNRYHIKIGGQWSGSALIRHNDFIRWDTNTPYDAAIWIMPNTTANFYGTNSGQGSAFIDNKFGNEHLGADTPRILIAGERPGFDRLSASHSTAFLGGGSNGAYLTGIRIAGNRNALTSAYAAPVIRSYVSEVRQIDYHNNPTDGGSPTYLIEFMGARENDYSNTNSSIHLKSSDNVTFTKGIVNQPIGVSYDDGGLSAAQRGTALIHSAGDETSFALMGYANEAEQLVVFAGARTVVADYKNALKAIEVTASDRNQGLYLSLSGIPIAGKLCWAEFDIARGTTNSVDNVSIDVFNYSTSIYAYRGTIALPQGVQTSPFVLAEQDEWVRVRVPFIMAGSATPGSWQFRVYTNSYNMIANRFRVARIYVHAGKQPQNDAHIRTLGTGLWDGEHIVMGAGTHLWHDGAGGLRIKAAAAPNSVTDGTPFGLKVDVPASAVAAGTPGMWAVDAAYHYSYSGDGVTHAWRRVAHTSW